MKKYLFLFLSLASFITLAQEKLSLEQCYALAETNYPLAKQSELLEKKANSEIDILNKGKLPQLDFNAQASYQSDVIQLPSQIPNLNMETPNKDQYRATIDANQLIYHGGRITAQTKLKTAEIKAQQQQIEVNLYTLKSVINQSFFNVLLFQEQTNLLHSKMDQLKARAKELESGVKHGAVLSSSLQLLKAEILKLEQQLSETSFDHKKAIDKLSLLLAKNLDRHTKLERPDIFISSQTESSRPELALYDLQQNQLETSKELLSKKNYPSLYGFTQLEYGNPGLNMLDNSFQDFYVIGLKLKWNIFDWGKTKQEKQIIDFSKEIVSTEKKTFQLNNKIELTEIESDISKYEEMLEKDEGIIAMREKVLKAYATQMHNGAITFSAYVTELNKLYEAKTNQQLHEIQLVLVKANYKVFKG